MPKPIPILVAVAALIAAASTPSGSSSALAAEPCRTVQGKTDPAFAAPGGCVPVETRRPAASPGWTRAPDGSRRWSDGTTSLSVSGSVRFDAATGNSSGTPIR